MVYKLVAREDSSGELVGVAKRSVDKLSVGGRKSALRRRSPEGTAVEEVVGIGHAPADDGDDRVLLRPYVSRGEPVGAETLADVRARHVESLAELPSAARQLSRGEPVIPTRYEPLPG